MYRKRWIQARRRRLGNETSADVNAKCLDMRGIRASIEADYRGRLNRHSSFQDVIWGLFMEKLGMEISPLVGNKLPSKYTSYLCINDENVDFI